MEKIAQAGGLIGQAFAGPAESEKLRVLIIGSGGREHAIASRLEMSPLVDQIFVAPGNSGTSIGRKTGNVSILEDDFDALAAFADRAKINLVLPGPDGPLVDGIETLFRRIGIPFFGPSAKAAMLEGSKGYAKDFMIRHSIPTSSYHTFTSSEKAKAYVESKQTDRIVIKANGLAHGKGVYLPTTLPEALKALDDLMVRKLYGPSGETVVIEDYLEGEEISVLALCDGYTILPFPAVQDHKRIGEGNTGPNTGGMGTFCPVPCYTRSVEQEVMEKILKPTIEGMRRDGTPFLGCLFVGVMILPDGSPKVLEYNVRFGDPEVQSLIHLLSAQVDLANVIKAAVDRRLDCVDLKMDEGSCVTVVLASKGYPGRFEKGKVLKIDQLPPGVAVFHAGTTTSQGEFVTAGGRVLNVTAKASQLEDAISLAYDVIDRKIDFDGMTFRRDIARRGLSAS